MSTFITILLTINAILLILVTLLQNAKKDGVSNNGLGNTGVYQVIGVKKTSDLLEQITWGLVISLFSLSLLHSLLLKSRNTSPSISPNLERLQEQRFAPASTAESDTVAQESTPSNPVQKD